MKKIAFVIESLQCGGAEKSLVTLLQNMNFEKFKIDLILTVGKGEFVKFVPKMVDVKVIDVFSKISSFKLNMLRLVLAFQKKLKNSSKYHAAQLHWKTYGKYVQKIEQEYDIAIAYNQGLATYIVAEKMVATKKLAWLNTDYLKAGYNINFDFDKYNVFDKIVTVSDEGKNSFVTQLNSIGCNLQTVVIKDITDINLVNKLSKEHQGLNKNPLDINICSVGRLAKAKGYHLAIQACKILIDKGKIIKWFIIGNGPELNNIEELIKYYNLENHIELLGYQENPYPYIKTCDIYVQTSLFEGLGLTVIEAAILQKPIVTTNFPTAYNIIKNEETGLICEMTPISIANAIQRYLSDKIFKEKVVRNLALLKNNDKEMSLAKVNELLNT
tara:strand:- start:64 stop:1218 length:1155 start_codon:yes stop_codon:yes gene_type:complete